MPGHGRTPLGRGTVRNVRRGLPILGAAKEGGPDAIVARTRYISRGVVAGYLLGFGTVQVTFGLTPM
jgi:hypothetical protein